MDAKNEKVASDTPRVDAACGFILESTEEHNQSFEVLDGGGYVRADFARQVERENAELARDKARLDWLDSKPEQGVNTLAHESAGRRGHAYVNKRWIERDGGKHAEWDHFHAPTVRAAIDAAMAMQPQPARKD